MQSSPDTISAYARDPRRSRWEADYRARVRSAARRELSSHPSLQALRGAAPSVELFERVLREVPARVRRACFDLPTSQDALWPLAQWMRAHVRRRVGLEVIGALYGLTRERIRQIEEAALVRLRKPMSTWQGRVLEAGQRGPSAWDVMAARAA